MQVIVLKNAFLYVTSEKSRYVIPEKSRFSIGQSALLRHNCINGVQCRSFQWYVFSSMAAPWNNIQKSNLQVLKNAFLYGTLILKINRFSIRQSALFRLNCRNGVQYICFEWSMKTGMSHGFLDSIWNVSFLPNCALRSHYGFSHFHTTCHFFWATYFRNMAVIWTSIIRLERADNSPSTKYNIIMLNRKMKVKTNDMKNEKTGVILHWLCTVLVHTDCAPALLPNMFWVSLVSHTLYTVSSPPIGCSRVWPLMLSLLTCLNTA